MTRTFSLLIEGDESGYSAYIPELPSILVTARSIDELRRRATEAIQVWWEESGQSPPSPETIREEIEVELRR